MAPHRSPADWAVRAPDPEVVRAIRERTGLSRISSSVLANRGLPGGEAAEAFLETSLATLPDPSTLAGMGDAVARILAAAARGEKVLVYADYDVDGSTAGAILVLFLRDAFPSLTVLLHQNRRDDEGYGLSASRLGEYAREGVTLVVTVDCGVTDHTAVERAVSLGVDVIVTDHHLPGGTLPPALAVLDPKRADCLYPDRELAGVGVAFMLLCALRSALRGEGAFRDRPEPNLGSYLDLVALGTVADVASLTGVNRALVRAGLAVLRRGERTGLKALMERAAVTPSSAGETDLAFRLGPRLNAAGRMGDPGLATRLLLCGDAAEAAALSLQLDGENRRRQAEEERVLAEAEAAVRGAAPGAGAIVAWGEGWHPGVLGIVASRLAERHGRPAVVLRVDGEKAHGSARAVEGFHMVEALSAVHALLDRFGGHRQAAGLALRSDRLERFREEFRRVSGSLLPAAPPAVSADAEVALHEVDGALLAEWERLRPFGPGNEEPLLSSRAVRVVRRTPMGSAGNHFRLLVEKDGATREVNAFHRPDGVAPEGGAVDLLFTPVEDRWRGSRNIRLVLRGARPA